MQSNQRVAKRLRWSLALALVGLVGSTSAVAEPVQTDAATVHGPSTDVVRASTEAVDAPVAAALVERIDERAHGGPIDRIVDSFVTPRLTKAVNEMRVLQRGVASWYGRQFHGRRTANGERFDMYALTAAHPSLPMSSYVRVRNLRNDRSIIVRVNDRGPFHRGRIIDLSFSAARQLDVLGTAAVEIERLTEAELRSGGLRRVAMIAAPGSAAAVPTSFRLARVQVEEAVPASRWVDGAGDASEIARFDRSLVARAIAQTESWQQLVATSR